MMSDFSISDAEAYANCMGEMRSRLFKIDSPPTGYLDGIFYLEFMCLQMRKICELFAFGSLTANREAYEKMKKDYQNESGFNRILRVVEKVNPKYFPAALHPIPIEDKKTGVKTIKGFAGENVSFLTKEDISKIFSECSDFMHAQNHFKDLQTFYPMNGTEFLPWKKKLIKWRDEFIKLFNCHIIGQKGSKLYICYMHMEDKNKKIEVISLN